MNTKRICRILLSSFAVGVTLCQLWEGPARFGKPVSVNETAAPGVSPPRESNKFSTDRHAENTEQKPVKNEPLEETDSYPVVNSVHENRPEKKNDELKSTDESEVNDPCQGKEKLVSLLESNRGKEVDCSSLPTWDLVIERYGSKPVIHGLERCEEYRNSLKGAKPKPRVAGMYNSGTNNLATLLELNLEKLGNKFRHEAPFGKHLLPTYFGHNIYTQNDDDRAGNPLHILPVVVVRDPFLWMNAMCKNSYYVRWKKPLNQQHCPILKPSKEDYITYEANKSATVNYRLEQVTSDRVREHHPSLAHMWKSYHEAWMDFKLPRLIVRTEDIVFRGPQVLDAIATCAGIKPFKDTYQNVVGPAKSHGKSNNLSRVLAQYRGDSVRYGNLSQVDVDFVRPVLNRTLLEKFHYPEIPETVNWQLFQHGEAN